MTSLKMKGIMDPAGMRSIMQQRWFFVSEAAAPLRPTGCAPITTDDGVMQRKCMKCVRPPLIWVTVNGFSKGSLGPGVTILAQERCMMRHAWGIIWHVHLEGRSRQTGGRGRGAETCFAGEVCGFPLGFGRGQHAF